MIQFRDLLLQNLTGETIWVITICVGFLWLLISFLAYESYKTTFYMQYGRSLQKPGILNRWSPNHAVSADMFRAKITDNMSLRIAAMLISYRISVVLFYTVIIADLLYLIIRFMPFSK